MLVNHTVFANMASGSLLLPVAASWRYSNKEVVGSIVNMNPFKNQHFPSLHQVVPYVLERGVSQSVNISSRLSFFNYSASIFKILNCKQHAVTRCPLTLHVIRYGQNKKTHGQWHHINSQRYRVSHPPSVAWLQLCNCIPVAKWKTVDSFLVKYACPQVFTNVVV